MSLLVPEASSVLRTHCPDWDFTNPPLDPTEVTTKLLATMLYEDGIGIAAPQIGFSYRVFLMQVDGRTLVCFNPTVTAQSSETVVIKEGCLSFPGLRINVERAAEISVKYQTADGEFQEENLTGMLARCYLHELDHLNGTCFTERVSKLVLAMAKKRREKNGRKS